MESFAFWYREKPDAGEQRVTATMNFNLWCQCGWSVKPYLDFGFNIHNLQSADTLYFFIPFVINESEKTNL